jgi:beta-lactamase class A
VRNRLKVGWRVALGLTVASIGAGVLGGPWGIAVRADARTFIAGAPPSRTAPGVLSAPVNGSGPAQAAPRSATDAAQAAVNAAVPRLIAGRSPDSVSIVGIDGTSGATVGWGNHTVMPAASVFKLTLLEGYLLRNQDRGQRPGEGASDALTMMIENSDNDAADQVYGALGGHVGVTSRMRRLGLSSSRLGPHDQWGLSTTSAADQSILLTDLVSTESPLTAASRAYGLRLLVNVEPDQRWGVGDAADTATTFANKNGWLDVDDDDGRWVVSSVGLIAVDGRQVLLAVLTQHSADLTDGIHLVQALSRTLATALRDATTLPR